MIYQVKAHIRGGKLKSDRFSDIKTAMDWAREVREETGVDWVDVIEEESGKKVTTIRNLSSLRDRIALAAVRRELAGDDLILWGRLDPSDPYIKLTDNVSRAEQKRWESKGYQVRVVAAGKRPDNV